MKLSNQMFLAVLILMAPHMPRPVLNGAIAGCLLVGILAAIGEV